MQWVGVIAGALALLAVTTCPADAGLYNTAEQAGIPPRDFRTFQEMLASLRAGTLPIRIEVDGKTYVIRTALYRRQELVASLSGRGLPNLTVEQRLDVSAYLIRLHKFREAIDVLTPARRQEPGNPLVLSNLATGEQLDGQLLRARDYLSDALSQWPKTWARQWDVPENRPRWLQDVGWNEQQFSWYHEVETYQLKLLRLRSREAARGTAQALPENVDALFDTSANSAGKLMFVGPSGKYEAGKLAPDQRARIPPKAIEIVEQLLLWMPFDPRLEWLLGELYNAEEDVPAAKAILKDVATKWNPPTQKGFSREAALPALFKEHLGVLQGQTTAEPTVVESPPALPTLPAPADTPPDKAVPPVDWKSLGVGFGGGIVVAFLAAWQVKEIRRKRRTGSIA